MAAGLAKLGAAMDVKLAEANCPLVNAAVLFAAAPGVAAVLAHADNSVLADMAPKGSIGMLAKNFRAWRREDSGR
jgi:hypothetical protein